MHWLSARLTCKRFSLTNRDPTEEPQNKLYLHLPSLKGSIMVYTMGLVLGQPSQFIIFKAQPLSEVLTNIMNSLKLTEFCLSLSCSVLVFAADPPSEVPLGIGSKSEARTRISEVPVMFWFQQDTGEFMLMRQKREQRSLEQDVVIW